MKKTGDDFIAHAMRIALGTLRWTPTEFWAATPREFWCALRGIEAHALMAPEAVQELQNMLVKNDAR